MKKNTKADVFEIKNSHIDPVYSLLHPLELSGAKTRAKIKFLWILQGMANEYDQARKIILDKYGKRDDANKLVVERGENGKETVQIKEDSIEDFTKEMGELLNAKAKVDLLASNKEMFEELKNILAEIEQVPAELQFVYAEICDELDKI